MIYYDRIDVSEGTVLIKQANEKSVMFVTIGVFKIKILSFKCLFAVVVMFYW